MERGVKLLRRSPAGPLLMRWLGRLLLAVGLLGLTLLAPTRAHAQATPRLAVSMVVHEVEDADVTRDGWQIANIGDTAWDPTNYFVCRIADSLTPQVGFVRITGVDPVPPNGVLDIEWSRPLSGGVVTCATKGNVFCTGGTFADGTDFSGSDDLVTTQALAVFAPTTGNAVPTVDSGTMLAYYFQGDPTAIDKGEYGYTKAVNAKLWTDGNACENTGDLTLGDLTEDWCVSLRMGPGPYPAGHGSHDTDYFHSLINLVTTDTAGVSLEDPSGRLNSFSGPGAAPNQRRRAGLWTQPTYQWGGPPPIPPIPGQIAAGLYAISAPQAVTASLAANSPATGMVVAVIDKDGAVQASVQSNGNWSPWVKFTGPAADGIALIDNPKNLTRTLLVRSRSDGKLMGATGPTDTKTPITGVTALQDLGHAVQFAPAAAVDPATGNEYYAAVEAGTKAILFNTLVGGKLGSWQTIAGVTTDAPVAAAWIPDTSQVAVVAWNGNQLALNLGDATGKFGTWQNVGAAVSARPAGIGPVAAWNPQAKNLEMVATTGTISNDPGADDGYSNDPTYIGTSQPSADIQHARAQISRTAATVGALAKVAGISTMVAPTIAIDTGTGNIRMVEREGAGHEPGLVFGAEAANGTADPPGSIHQGFAYQLTFDGTKWSDPSRVGVAVLPGPSPATPLFKAAVPPVTLFDANTKKFEDILIGQDAQVYVVPVP